MNQCNFAWEKSINRAIQEIKTVKTDSNSNFRIKLSLNY